jgi:hypothetical protein
MSIGNGQGSRAVRGTKGAFGQLLQFLGAFPFNWKTRGLRLAEDRCAKTFCQFAKLLSVLLGHEKAGRIDLFAGEGGLGFAVRRAGKGIWPMACLRPAVTGTSASTALWLGLVASGAALTSCATTQADTIADINWEVNHFR